jgi:hypothetical protein
MAQTKKKRSRKHRGTPAGTIERAGRTGSAGKAKAKADPKQAARERRAERMNRPPTWRGAVNRAAVAALIFGVLIAVVRSPAQAAPLALLMFVVYIPLGFMTDKAVFNFRNRRRR